MAPDWPQYNLGELCSLITDGKHGDCEDQPNSGFYFLSVKDILGNRLVYDNARQITKTDFLETHRRTNLEPGDVLFTNTGTIGRMAIAQNDPRTYRTTFQKSVAILKPKRNVIDPHFLYYLLHFENAKLCEFAAGTTQKNLLLQDFRRFVVRVPKLNEQSLIVDILRTLDDKIELNREMNETLEAIARAIFKSWFVDFDPVCAKAEGRKPYGLSAETAALFPNSFREGIPLGWEESTLATFTELQNGYAFKSSDWQEVGVPVVKIGSVKPGIVNIKDVSFVSAELAEQHSLFRLQPGDILVGLTGYVGETGRVPPTSNPPLLNQRVARFRPKKVQGEPSAFVYACVRDPKFKDFATAKAHGSAQPNVSVSELLSYPLVNPGQQIIKAFEDTFRPLLSLLLANCGEVDTLNDLRDFLLPKLLCGEIKVKDVGKLVPA